MSVLIKGMEMPTSCDKCRISFNIGRSEYLCQLCTDPNPCTEDGEFWRECGEGADEKRPNWCPLVPIPSHGDLIDRRDLKNKEITIDYDEWDDTFDDGLLFVADLIDNAPTIIEAEVDNERTD